MKTLCFEASDIKKGSLVLINAAHPLACTVPTNSLEPVQLGSSILLNKQAGCTLTTILAMLHCGQAIVPVSGYRSTQEQEQIYTDALRDHGQIFTQKYVALPGCSEHQTGLAIDLAENQEDIDFIRPHFPYTGICGRFRELAILHGFIERYPAGREAITGIAHEPWHFRYVGAPHAEIMTQENLTLEEYTSYLKQFAYEGNHLYFTNEMDSYEIFYVSVPEGEFVAVEVPADIPYEASGNNVDAVVVTLRSPLL